MTLKNRINKLEKSLSNDPKVFIADEEFDLSDPIEYARQVQNARSSLGLRLREPVILLTPTEARL